MILQRVKREIGTCDLCRNKATYHVLLRTFFYSKGVYLCKKHMIEYNENYGGLKYYGK